MNEFAIRTAGNLQGIVVGRLRDHVSFLGHLAQRYWEEALSHGAPRPATIAVRCRTFSRKIGRHNLLLDRPLFVDRLRRAVTSALAKGHLELRAVSAREVAIPTTIQADSHAHQQPAMRAARDNLKYLPDRFQRLRWP